MLRQNSQLGNIQGNHVQSTEEEGQRVRRALDKASDRRWDALQ